MFSDGTEYHRTPVEPREGDTVTIRFRTQRNNVDNVCLVHDGEYLEMKRERTPEVFDYYTAQIIMGKDIVRYYFEIHSGLLPAIMIQMVLAPGMRNGQNLRSIRIIMCRNG